MKKIYYRKSTSEYEKGYFISFNIIILLLIVFVYLFFHFLYLLGLPDWVQVPLWVIVGISFFYLLGIEGKNKITVSKKGDRGFEIKISDYLNKKIKKKKGKSIRAHSGGSRISFIGEYEFDSIITYNQNLLDFYENCLTELDELKKNDIKKFNSVEIIQEKDRVVHHYNNNGKIDFEKFRRLKYILVYRIKMLKKINELKID